MSELDALEPTRDLHATLPDLVETLLNRGVYLDLDRIVAVADIPLIGVNVKATLAGMETMVTYGMMQNWDERTRAWVQRSALQDVPLRAGEHLVTKIAGSYYEGGFSDVWRPGSVHVTDQRLFVFRREPREMLWENALDGVRGLRFRTERSVGGEQRSRLLVRLTDGSEAMLSASNPNHLYEVVPRSVCPARTFPAGEPVIEGEEPDTMLVEGAVSYHEARAGSTLWRGGTGRIDRLTELSWRSPLDARAAVNLQRDQILNVRAQPERTPAGRSQVLTIDTADGPVRLAPSDVPAWLRALRVLLDDAPATNASRGGDDAAHSR